MRLAIVIPLRVQPGSDRERVWLHLKPLWHTAVKELGDTDLIVVDDSVEPFSIPRIINGAIRQLDHDIVHLYGADQFPHVPAIREARARIEAGQPWTHVFGKVTYLTERCTRQILKGERVRYAVEHEEPLAPGLLMYRRDVWLDINGFDERFAAWGYGDCAQLDALGTLYPIPPGYPDHELIELHVPATGWALQRDRTLANPNRVLWETRYVPARGNRDAMRRVVNEWRLPSALRNTAPRQS